MDENILQQKSKIRYIHVHTYVHTYKVCLIIHYSMVANLFMIYTHFIKMSLNARVQTIVRRLAIQYGMVENLFMITTKDVNT